MFNSFKHRRALQVGSVLCMAWLFYAFDGSVVQVLITNEDFIKTFNLNPQRLGLFALFPSVGALIGQLGITSTLSRVLGRKWTFQVATLMVVLGVILQTFTNNWPAVLAGRIIGGIGGDANGLNLGYYVTEIAPKHVRGRALIFLQQFSGGFLNIIGAWVMYGMAYLPQDKAYSWKVANSLQFVPAAIFFSLVFTLPESPRWLALKYPDDDSPMVKSLAFIRDVPETDRKVTDEARDIRAYNTWHMQHGSIKWYTVFTQRRFLKRMAYGFVPFLGIQFTGVGLLTIYATVVYQSLGLNSQKNALLLNSCLQIAYAAGSLGSTFVVEKLGRRPCIVWGSLVNTIGLAFIVGLAVGFEHHTSNIANGFIVFFIASMTFNYYLLLTGPAVVYVNEIMPTQGREFGVSVCNVIPIAIGIALGQKWPTASATLGAKSYCILLATSSVGTVLNYFFVKEPKGLSLESIDVLFGEVNHVEEVEEQEVQDGKEQRPELLEYATTAGKS